MTKFRIDVFSYLLGSIAGGSLIWFKGDLLWLDTEAKKTLAIIALCAFLIAIALYFGFEPRREEADASRRLIKQLRWNATRLTGTTQALLVPRDERAADAGTSDCLMRLRARLRHEHGFRWRYRQPWLLITGDHPVIERMLPELAIHGWLVTQDAVLLSSKTGTDGQPDVQWLRQLYKLRRRRPIDAVVLTVDGAVDLPPPRSSRDADSIKLARIADALRWSAPVFVVDVAQTDANANCDTPVAGCEFAHMADSAAIATALLELRDRLADLSVTQLSRNASDRYAAELSERLDTRSAALANWIAELSNRQRWHHHVGGVYFAPYPLQADRPGQGPTSADLPLWKHVSEAARTETGRRIGWHPVTVFSIAAFAAISVWAAGMLVSGLTNARELHLTSQALQALDRAPDPASRLRALLALQQRIALHEHRTQHGAPLAARFGLNHDADILAALWKPYSQAIQRALVTPVHQNLEAQLVDLSQMQTAQLDDPTNRLALEGHKVLKTYLMMAEPDRADAEFMTPVLTQYWSTNADLPAGEKRDLSERLLGFYAQHLRAHAAWRIEPRPELVNASRQTLLTVIGVKNSADTIYQGILEAVGNRYPGQTLSSLTAGTDTRGLLRATATVRGPFTRQAYEGAIAAAIDDAAKRSAVTGDWVLADGSGGQRQQEPAHSGDALRTELTSRYFADYADQWQRFMNTLQWESAPTLPSAIEQLQLMADARQSPVIALLKSIEYQGGAGALKESLSDTLVTKAQTMLSGKTHGPQRAKPDPAGPLGMSFGPVLRLVAQTDGNGAANGELSLQRFMERITTLRLKLQQISDSPDAEAQARRVARSLFQGKGSELADTQAYAQLIAASLGSQWAGMGSALFVRPISQAMQTVLHPAQASLNDAWRQTIVATWNRSFAGRYPFANTDNDASLPELARFLRPQGGLIAAFLSTQLAGVLELQGDDWMPIAEGGAAMAVDPAFLKAVNTLQRIAGHWLAQGEPQYRFELKAVPTPGVTESVLSLDGRKLHYYNQRETWQAFTWPSNNRQDVGTRLQWQTEKAGTNKSFEFADRWGLVRMLERASVEPIDSATFQLTWRAAPEMRISASAQQVVMSVSESIAEKAAGTVSQDVGTGRIAAPDLESLNARGPLVPTSSEFVSPLSYMMRTDVGRGPLEMLALRGFALPERIFVDKRRDVAVRAQNAAQSDAPPPLPRAMLDAAKQAETPLPRGDRPL